MYTKTTRFPTGSCLQDEISCSYQDLVKVLGKPNAKGDGYKVTTEWVLENGRNLFTVYDWKESKKYDPDGMLVKEIRSEKILNWHIGGFHQEACRQFKEWLEGQIKTTTNA